MDFKLSFLSKGDISDIGECIPLLAKEGAENFNIFIDSSEVFNHWEEFRKNLFVADLLGFNGVFILGKLDQSIESEMKGLFSKSVFNTLGQTVFLQEKSKTIDFPKRKRELVVKRQNEKYTDQIRTIVVWNGTGILSPGLKIEVEFIEEDRVGEVKQIQKVIQDNFEGSAFGINRLESGEIGTTTIILNKKIEMFYYNKNNNQGVFEIKKNKTQIGYGIIIG